VRPLTLALIALLLAPAGAAGKPQHAPVRVKWNSSFPDVRAPGSWDARLSLLQGPGGFYGRNVRPVIVVTSLAGGAERRVAMVVDVPPNTFRATVPFPRPGSYAISVAEFDPRRPARVDHLGAISVERAPPAASTAGGEAWLWGLGMGTAITALVGGAWTVQRVRLRRIG
jgi:hypothetical protein